MREMREIREERKTAFSRRGEEEKPFGKTFPYFPEFPDFPKKEGKGMKRQVRPPPAYPTIGRRRPIPPSAIRRMVPPFPAELGREGWLTRRTNDKLL